MNRLATLRLTPAVQQSLALVLATTVAYGLDYMFNLAAGRMLAPADFGIVVSLAAAGQVLVVASRVIQTVATRYIARYRAEPDAERRTLAFFRAAFRSAWWWGLAATVLLVVLSWPLARFLQIDELGPVLALAVTTLLFAVRPVSGGVLQGQQRFAALGSVQIVQAVMRLAAGVLLIMLGWGAFGATVALPIASAVALVFALWLLGQSFSRSLWRLIIPRRRAGRPNVSPVPGLSHDVILPELFRYSAFTAGGLIGFALLINMDAILVKRFFDPVTAGQYSAAVTLGKIVQFFPLAIIMILFPKAAHRRATHRDATAILLLAMAIVGAACIALTVIYFLFGPQLIELIFGPAYALPGNILGLLSLAMTLLSLLNVWLNYFLSTERTRFIYLIWAGIVGQLLLMRLFHQELWQLPAAMIVSGTWLTAAGLLFYLWGRRHPAEL
jgi:O-antigen/teichoic acid export membrane protein